MFYRMTLKKLSANSVLLTCSSGSCGNGLEISFQSRCINELMVNLYLSTPVLSGSYRCDEFRYLVRCIEFLEKKCCLDAVLSDVSVLRADIQCWVYTVCQFWGLGPNILQRNPSINAPNDYVATCHKVLKMHYELYVVHHTEVIDCCNCLTDEFLVL